MRNKFMLNLSNLKPARKKKARKRVGRGLGSGHGTYCGRGIKGQKARSGGSIPPGFEGGRMPFIRQIPKVRGFKAVHPKPEIVSLEDVFKVFPDGDIVSPKNLFDKGLTKSLRSQVKVVGKTESMDKKLEFKNIKLSAGAKAIIEKAGGKVSDA